MGHFFTPEEPPSFLLAFRLPPRYAVKSKAFTLVFRIGSCLLHLRRYYNLLYYLKRKHRYAFTTSGRPPRRAAEIRVLHI